MRPTKNLMFVIPSLAGGGAERTQVHNILNDLDVSRYRATVVLFDDVITYESAIRFPARWVTLGKRSKWDVFRVILPLRHTLARGHADSVLSCSARGSAVMSTIQSRGNVNE